MRRSHAAVLAAAVVLAYAAAPASAHKSSDPLHAGQGAGVTVIGHSDLGGAGLNGQLDVLGDYAYVGAGTNGGFAAQWNKTPKCEGQPNKVKVVSLKDPANPTVVSTIDVTLPPPSENPGDTVARAVSVIKVKPLTSGNAFTGDLLAVALESCGGNGRLGIELYDVSNPSQPIRVGTDTPLFGTATRDVSLVQRPDGRVLALEANQSGGIRVVDVTVPTAPLPEGTFTTSSSGQGCRPFSFAQGVAANATGSRAYAAYGDAGLVTLDISSPMPGTAPPKLAQALNDASQEGNSFRFVPNVDETAALATDEDLLPASTTLTVTTGPAAGVFRGCEAIWGNPLYRQATPSLADRQVVFVANGGCPADYTGLDVAGKVVLVDRTGSGDCFSFDGKARVAQQRGAVAVLVANTSATEAVFSPDSAAAGDAGVSIPLALVGKGAGDAIKAGLAGKKTVVGTLADNPDTWGALRIFNLPAPGANPTQSAVFNAPHTKVLTPGNGLYHAVNPLWDGNRALVAWMSDGLRVVDLADRSAPKAGPFYVPPGVADPTGNYGKVPLVVDVAKFGDRVVISDINGGLYVLKLRAAASGPGGPGSVPKGCNSAGVKILGKTNDGGRVLQGSNGNDRICGTSLGDVITGNGGGDVITGGGGDDRINGGSGSDRINGGSGKDRISGSSGNDRISGSRGNDRINGNSGKDRINGNSGNDRLTGATGNDIVSGSTGKDVISGSSGNDRLSGNSGNDRINGNSGNDRISGGSGNDLLKGSSGNDRIKGNSGRDRISGGSGRDRISGGSGNDRISGGSGRDRISGGSGRDRIKQ
jgi:hypothetical protein